MAPKRTAVISFSAAEIEYAGLVAQVVAPIVPGLARALGPHVEVLLHDLSRYPNSIVAISGDVTGRSVGGPPTDLGVKVLASNATEDMIAYRTELDTGVVLRSSSLFFRAPMTGRTVAALCINADVSELTKVQEILAAIALPLRQADRMADNAPVPQESFPASVDVLAQGILRDAVAASGVVVDLMKKSHKLAVVRELDDRGFFTLRESVDLAAKGLGVSRYTVYNYLNEIESSQQAARDEAGGLGSG